MVGYCDLSAYVNQYIQHLQEQERASLTVEKYRRDVYNFLAFFQSVKIPGKSAVIQYKEALECRLTATSVNSALSAVNGFLKFAGFPDWCVKPIRIQRKIFCLRERELNKEEYWRLLSEAQRQGKTRLSLILQTLCATGIRVSELPSITVDAARMGRTEVFCKSKCRVILLPHTLCRLLLRYVQRCGIVSGSIFVTRGGRTLDRSNIWTEMKKLCAKARVASSKVFPHNLRHLFARTYYSKEKDLTRLADLLGHSNINTTRIYIISSGEEHGRQIDRMGLTFA